MKIDFLGGAQEIGGSCIYVRAEDCKYVMDAGIRQSSSKDALPNFQAIQDGGGLDFILISHAHMDHIGSLPVLSKAFPNALIYMTQMSAELTRVLLYDGLKLMDQNEEEIPHYSELDVKNMLNRIRPLRFQSRTQISETVSIEFFPAGHIAGAACIQLESLEGTIFYSGDFSTFSQRTIEGARIPKLRPDIAICESTYGNRIHANRQVEEARLITLVNDVVSKGHKVLIPAFALGRSQEVLLILKNAMNKGEIPHTPVYVDGMVRSINAVYKNHSTFLKNSLSKSILKGIEPFYNDDIHPVDNHTQRDELVRKDGPAIFVSSSGMLTGGPSATYASSILADENNCLILTGYQDEESPGRMLLNLMDESIIEKQITINHKTILVKSKVEQVGLSAHSDKSEVEGLLERLGARKIFLVHGNEEALDQLSTQLSQDFRRQIYIPKCTETYSIHLNVKRKQLKFTLNHTLSESGDIQEEKLYEFWNNMYPGKKFTIEQVTTLWTGKTTHEEDYLDKIQKQLMNSVYFHPDRYRLFLYETSSVEEIQEQLSKNEYTQQDLEQMLAGCSMLPIRKKSFHVLTKEVILTFDFPDAIDIKEFNILKNNFQAQSGWTLKINKKPNFQMMQMCARTLFGSQISKMSYYEFAKEFSITLKEKTESDLIHKKMFEEKTGWTLLINEKGKNTSIEEQSAFFEVPAMEQNTAIQYIDSALIDSPIKPYKKGIKVDQHGKYFELSFLSPILGLRIKNKLLEISEQIGWRIQVSKSVNQNELTNIAIQKCAENHLSIAKNPSYRPESHTLVIKLNQLENNIQFIQDEFFEETGIKLKFEKA
ncbi:MAG: MBL fold metallo-hydrolase [Firmicutes bacterium]|nr:MBL fold metallo-hydrolase [Bacillota bacterium]